MNEKRIADIQGYEDVKNYYYITSEGQIISLRNNIPRVMAFRLSGVGYYYALLATKTQKQLQEPIHRIVARAFINNDNPCKTIVHHKDHNKLNNQVNNLTWVTPEENIRHSIEKQLSIHEI